MNSHLTQTADETRHPYRRPRDSATLILVDRNGSVPKVLLGRRRADLVFMPNKLVFPGGSVDATDHRIPLATELPNALETKLVAGSPKTTPARARALVVAAIREACEETGLCLGSKPPIPLTPVQIATLKGEWRPFAETGLLPDPSQLYLIARAITPPGLVRRFDTRFFTADISAIAHIVNGVVHADAELVELKWIELGAAPLADIHSMTQSVLDELNARLTMGPLTHQAEVPFFHFRNGARLRDTL
ncbi:MAG: NUDIX hydrolase [Bradyrhizobiaceae bacterium]|nr:MAG: NUDIX hydrolase [Bradyrhizobiaceae bacterium]